MRWEDERESSNVEDVRGFPIGGRGASIGCGGLIVVLLISWLTGVSPVRILNLIQGTDSGTPSSQTSARPAPGSPPGEAAPAPADTLGKFSSVVLASTEDVWSGIFAKNGRTYEPPRLVLFSGAVRSACGMTSAAVGPFYCQLDRKVYLDTSFFQELSRRFGAPGEFADAYVIAHEVGHHVQNLQGVFDRVGRGDGNQTSVRLELQADCYAGVWGNHANREQKLIEPGDFEAGLRAASAIGDDRLQRMSQGFVAPDSFTHGSSGDRRAWLRRGLESGDPGQCDTFHAE
jgi:predicted metalloprotease